MLKVTKTRGRKGYVSIRSKTSALPTGWDIISHLAKLNNMATTMFIARFNPSVFDDHIEIERWYLLDMVIEVLEPIDCTSI